jgi:predicted ATPase
LSEAAHAESSLQQSLLTARRQHAKLWELRAACTLGLLWRDQGRRNDAGDLLRPIYSSFTEGFGTPDLRDAKELLDALRE